MGQKQQSVLLEFVYPQDQMIMLFTIHTLENQILMFVIYVTNFRVGLLLPRPEVK